MKMILKSPIIVPLLYVLFSITPSFSAQKVKITKIIDTNLFEVQYENKTDTVKLANIKIPSREISDSLLKKSLIERIWKYENTHMFHHFYTMHYATDKDSADSVRAVYLILNEWFGDKLINEKFLVKGFGTFIPIEKSAFEEKCRKAALSAQKNKKGIWNDDKYSHRELGKKRAALQFGVGKHPQNDNIVTRYQLSWQNEQNRFFSYYISYSQSFYKDLYYYEDSPQPPKEYLAKNILVNMNASINSAYIGLLLHLRFFLPYGVRGIEFFFPFLPSIGLNIGKINKFYLSFEVFAFYMLYPSFAAAHYFFKEPFNSIHFYYYLGDIEDYGMKYRLNVNWKLYKRFNMIYNVSYLKSYDSFNNKNYFWFTVGIGYVY